MKKKIFIPFMILIIYVVFDAINISSNCQETINVQDFLMTMYQGNVSIDVQDFTMDKMFSVSMVYLFFNICMSFVIGYIYQNEIEIYGTSYLLKRNSRKLWWKRLCTKCMGMTLVIHFLVLICFMVAAVLCGRLNFDFHYNFLENLYIDGDGLRAPDDINAAYVTVALIVMPVFVSITNVMIQLIVSIFSKAIYGVVTISALLVLSSYCINTWLIGNYWMLLRNSVVADNGLNMVNGCIIMAITICGTYFAGKTIFSKKDFY